MRKAVNLGKFAIATALVSSLVLPTTIFAAGTGDDPNFTEDIKSEKQIQAEKEKEEKSKDYFSKKLKNKKNQDQKIITDSVGGTYATISVPSYEQEKNYWCGPATTKQVLAYINGSSSSQSTYASLLGTTTDGTDFTKVDDVLNSKQDKNTYIYKSFASDEQSSWRDKMIWGIDNEYPTVLDLKISPSNMPKYESEVAGHILNTSGYDLDDWELRLTDPFDDGDRGVTLGNTWHPLDGVWEANQAHFRKAIIW